MVQKRDDTTVVHDETGRDNQGGTCPAYLASVCRATCSLRCARNRRERRLYPCHARNPQHLCFAATSELRKKVSPSGSTGLPRDTAVTCFIRVNVRARVYPETRRGAVPMLSVSSPRSPCCFWRHIGVHLRSSTACSPSVPQALPRRAFPQDPEDGSGREAGQASLMPQAYLFLDSRLNSSSTQCYT